MNEQYHPVEQPDEIPVREREDAMGSYLMMFAAFAVGLPLPIINLIAAIVYYYTNKGKSRFVDFHITQSLLSQIPTTLLNAGLVAWTISIFVREAGFSDYYKGYAAMVIVANIIYLIFSIIAAVRARKGQFYYFLLFGPWAYQMHYRIKPESIRDPMNKPPRL